MQIDLGEGKGVFHRLQAGPLPSRESADSLCNQLKAKNVEESLRIEKEMGRIIEKIERFKGQLKYLKNHVAYSTVTLVLREKRTVRRRGRRLPFGWVRRVGPGSLVRGY